MVFGKLQFHLLQDRTNTNFHTAAGVVKKRLFLVLAVQLLPAQQQIVLELLVQQL
jgi:hypothetical protein